MLKFKPLAFLSILLLIQTTSLTQLFGQSQKPDLLLLGILVLSLSNSPKNIIAESMLLGFILDLITAKFVGLHIIMAALIPLTIKLVSKRFSTSMPVLLFFFTTIFNLLYYSIIFILASLNVNSQGGFGLFLGKLLFPAWGVNLFFVFIVYFLYTETNQLIARYHGT